MVASKLKELGLTKGEIKVYLALLKIGISTKGPIASKAKVSESKVYEILDRLTAKGLVSNAMKKKGARQVKQFKAANPILLKDFLNKKKRAIEKEEKIVDSILPMLQAQLTAQDCEYSAVIYEGFKGIRTNNKEVLEMIGKDDEWMAMGVSSSKAKQYNAFWVQWLKQRAKRGGPARILFVDKATKYYQDLSKIKNTQVGYLKSVAPSAVVMTKNRVMILTYGDTPACLAITNKQVYESFKGFFESLWSLAKKN
ncbi:hypothetical protein HOC01_04760 [archaeon]|jgi:HTH-type transcriptional regulator, sugar sensing transcriptional regulator|nr:hypothetical protein [archaeon]MBT6698278.1 hypothetical protein [archaeon]